MNKGSKAELLIVRAEGLAWRVIISFLFSGFHGKNWRNI
jgi:hypothetical protein